jgi:hypothetical protein
VVLRPAALQDRCQGGAQGLEELRSKLVNLRGALSLANSQTASPKMAPSPNPKPNPLRSATMLPFSYRCPDCGWDVETLVASNEHDGY